MNKLITALATPFQKGKIDQESFVKLIQFQVKNKVDGLLVAGTTGEAQLLTRQEKKLLVALTKAVAGKTAVYVGVEGRSTRDATSEAVACESWGADGLLIAPPSFCKCTPKGYFLHVNELLKSVTIPLILYNAPSRCGYTLDQEIVQNLSEKVRYVKDAGSDLNYTAKLVKHMKVFCGSDGQLTQFLEKGATGVISVVSNVAPQLTRRVLGGERSRLFNKLSKLSMQEVSPIAVKYMLMKKGIFDSCEMRLPLTAAEQTTRDAIDAIWSGQIL